MTKHKLFFHLFVEISIMRLLLSIFFGNCFIFHHMWLLYLSYFLIIGIALFSHVPIVSLKHGARKAECIMLGDGTVTQEIFDKRRYSNFSLTCESEQGRAYSSNTGEMIYTKFMIMQGQEIDTVISLVLYIFLYTCMGLYTYELVYGVVTGTIDMSIPINTLKKNLETLNIMSDHYPVKENLQHVIDSLEYIWNNLQELLKIAYELMNS